MIGAINYKTFIDQPERASRPFDTQRNGFNISDPAILSAPRPLEFSKTDRIL
jgi:hypothetical protein